MKLGLDATQVEMRRGFLGGSDAGAIVAGGAEWPKLWAQKTGRADGEDLSGILAVMMGHATEPFNRFWYSKQTGRAVERAGELQLHPSVKWLAVNLDGVTTTADGQPATWQAKHVGKSGDQLILRYTAQCTHEALCCGYDWWVMSTFVGNSRWEVHESEVDPFFAAEYLDRCREFWWYVDTDKEPPPDMPPLGVPAPRAPLITVLLDDKDRSTWPNWGPEMADEMGAYARTLDAYKAHMAAKDNIKALLPEEVGTVIRGRIKVTKDRAGAVRVSLSKNGGRNERVRPRHRRDHTTGAIHSQRAARSENAADDRQSLPADQEGRQTVGV